MDKRKNDMKIIPSLIILGSIAFFIIWGINNAYPV
jgi:hypothetical protein